MNDKNGIDERKGPIVKTGPTRGEVRSRNQDGRWREKRSDAGKPREKSSDKSDKKGCFLTTAACALRGMPDDCMELETLRAFRDNVLAQTPEGRAMAATYYEISPRLVPLLDDPIVGHQVWKGIRTTVDHVRAGHTDEAIASYRGIVAGLLERATCLK